jgi:aldehyde dehydrogenase (NAD+)
VNATIWHLANPNLPFGGVGPSGIGAYHGRESFETFSHKKSVVTKSTRVDPKLAYPPYTPWKTAILKRLF